MANPEHLKILKQGVKTWNAWRKKNLEIIPDLNRANLNRANLAEANLAEANLFRANLTRAHLTRANLTNVNLNLAKLNGADLTKVNFSHGALIGTNFFRANLTNVNFYMANLRGAILIKVNLSRADLVGANFAWATFDGADLNGAVFGASVFSKTILHNVTGLDECFHQAPSPLDFSTLQNSWPLPPPFLRGCGLPDHYIEYLPSLLNQSPIQFYSCFISYSSKDEAFAKRLHADLQSNGVRCWFAPEDMKIGDKIRQTLHDSIRLYDKLLLILSEHSVVSTWVESEVETTFDKERHSGKLVLFPIRLDDVVMNTDAAWASDVRKRHIGNFTQWKNHGAYQKAFNRLMKDLKEEPEQKKRGK